VRLDAQERVAGDARRRLLGELAQRHGSQRLCLLRKRALGIARLVLTDSRQGNSRLVRSERARCAAQQSQLLGQVQAGRQYSRLGNRWPYRRGLDHFGRGRYQLRLGHILLRWRGASPSMRARPDARGVRRAFEWPLDTG
jgi:hypothetical protein